MTLSQIIFADWDVSPTIVAFSTTRLGGLSESPFVSFNLATHVGDDSQRVASNRALLKEQLPQQLEWQWLDQVHGDDVAVVNKAGATFSLLCADCRLPSFVRGCSRWHRGGCNSCWLERFSVRCHRKHYFAHVNF